MTILLYTPLWQRPELTRLHLQNVRRLVEYNPAQFRITPLYVVSEKWAMELCNDFGYRWTYAENSPLGAKLNDGLRAVIDENFDWLMTMGSDDFIDATFLDEYLPYFSSLDFFGTPEAYFLDARTGRQRRSVIWYPYGALRCLRWDVVRKASFWNGQYIGLWNKKQRQGLDHASQEAIEARTGIRAYPVRIKTRLWDVKTGDNINTFRKAGQEEVTLPASELPVELQKITRLGI